MRPFLCLILYMLSVFSLTAQAQPKPDNLAARYYEASGMGQMLGALKTSIAGRLNLQRLADSKIPLPANARQLASEALAQIDTQDIALDYLGSQLDQGTLSETMAFLESPVGLRIMQAEADASSDSSQTAMQAYHLQLAQTPPPRDRAQLMSALVKEAHMLESMMQLLERLYLMLADIARASASNAVVADLERELIREWQGLEPVLKRHFEQHVMMSANFSYRDLNSTELQQYIAFLSEPRGRIYWQSSVKVVDLYLNRFIRTYVSVLNAAGNF